LADVTCGPSGLRRSIVGNDADNLLAMGITCWVGRLVGDTPG